jgi:hypothetical protein
MKSRRVALLSLLVACHATNGVEPDASSDAPPEARREASDRGEATSPADANHAEDAARDASLREGGRDASLVRDPLQQPFASTSIWNMPIGSGAVYVPANIATATGTTLETDGDVIVLEPTAPALDIETNTADWNPTLSRCAPEGPLLFSAPVPSAFVVPDPMAQTPNSGLAVLLADGRTIKQTQPFARCTADQPGTSHYLFPDVDLYGPGIPGAHGGSGLSAIGGTLRLGELRRGGAAPRHVLKLELYAHADYYNDGKMVDCYRWPATGCDGYFDDATNPLRYGGTNPSLKPGSLLALPTKTSIASLGLSTQPAEMLAWTLQNYGAYLVDDTAWSATAICTEQGATGDFTAQFESDWGLAMDTKGTTGTFASDVARIVAALAVVDNNAPSTVGGGGTPLQPLAPPIAP